jgi:hypothetical protein
MVVFEYLWSVWRAIQLGLELEPEVVEIAQNSPNAGWIAVGVVMAAGVSLLLGQSVILFLNQVKPARFVVSLVSNGIVLVMGWVFWSASVWVIGRRLFGAEPPFDLLLILIGLSYAPLVFGFLILMPYLGPFIHRLLYVWSFLISLRAVSLLFQVGFWPALLCVGSGWLLLMLLTATIGRPIVALRNWTWQRITKTQKDAPVHELLKQFALDQSLPPPSKGDEQ